jgi:hypothetical protein
MQLSGRKVVVTKDIYSNAVVSLGAVKSECFASIVSAKIVFELTLDGSARINQHTRK